MYTFSLSPIFSLPCLNRVPCPITLSLFADTKLRMKKKSFFLFFHPYNDLPFSTALRSRAVSLQLSHDEFSPFSFSFVYCLVYSLSLAILLFFKRRFQTRTQEHFKKYNAKSCGKGKREIGNHYQMITMCLHRFINTYM